jgi:hypothetical protein
MRTIIRLATVMAATLLGVLGLVPAAHASRPITLTLYDQRDWEAGLHCPSGAGACTPVASTLYFTIAIADGRARTVPITIGWQVVDGTAVAGQDFTGPTSGTVTIPAGQVQAYFPIPLVYDGFNEPTETFTARMTSSSPIADISDTGLGTIWDGTEVPGDCSMAKSSAEVISMTCTNRPESQTWAIAALCLTMLGVDYFDGSPVTGNGTSSMDCGAGGAKGGLFEVLS